MFSYNYNKIYTINIIVPVLVKRHWQSISSGNIYNPQNLTSIDTIFFPQYSINHSRYN